MGNRGRSMEVFSCRIPGFRAYPTQANAETADPERRSRAFRHFQFPTSDSRP